MNSIKYVSINYDLTQFGVKNINNIMLSSEHDDGVYFEISFDRGKHFYSVEYLNKKTKAPLNGGNIQLRILFEKKQDIILITASGFFYNINIGTNIYFTGSKTYSVIVGPQGYYNIKLPRGLYKVWYRSFSGEEIVIDEDYNPENHRIVSSIQDKNLNIEVLFRDIEWAEYVIFDTFDNLNKKLSGNAILDNEGNLFDPESGLKCKYWAICFN